MSDPLLVLSGAIGADLIKAELTQRIAGLEKDLAARFEEWRNTSTDPLEFMQQAARTIGLRNLAEKRLASVDASYTVPARVEPAAEILALVKTASRRRDQTIGYLRGMLSHHVAVKRADLARADSSVALIAQQYHESLGRPDITPLVIGAETALDQALAGVGSHLGIRDRLATELGGIDPDGGHDAAIAAVVARFGRASVVKAVTRQTHDAEASKIQSQAARLAARLNEVDADSEAFKIVSGQLETVKAALAKRVAGASQRATEAAEALVQRMLGGDDAAEHDVLALAGGELRAALEVTRGSDPELVAMISLLTQGVTPNGK